MKIRDRIKEFKRVSAKDLLPNPQNWRKHPKSQINALRGILAEVGIAQAVLVRETKNGLMLIDGHLRAEELLNSELPVLVLDVTEEEAKKLLIAFDPIGELAEKDKDIFENLLSEISFSNEFLTEIFSFSDSDEVDEVANFVDLDENFQILIDCKNEVEQAELLKRLTEEGINCKSLIS